MNYEMPMEQIRLSHQQAHLTSQEEEAGAYDTSPTITTLRDSSSDTLLSLIGASSTISAPSFILTYRIKAAISPGIGDFQSIEDHTRFFITEQLGKTFRHGGIGIAKKSFASIRDETNKPADSFDIVFVPVFLFDSTWSTIPSEVDVDKILIAMFSGQSLAEYTSSLSHLSPNNAFSTTNSVVFKRSQGVGLDNNEQKSSNTPYFAAACAGIITVLILFLWNQSMRVRSLMKRRAKGIETETRGKDEEAGNTDQPDSDNNEVSDSDSHSSLDESLIEEYFRSPLFPCLSDLKTGSTHSQSVRQSLKGHHMVNQSEKRRCEVFNNNPGYISCDIVSDEGSSASVDDIFTYEVENSTSFEQQLPLHKSHSTLDSIFGGVKSRKKSSKTCHKSSDDESCPGKGESYSVEACDSSFEQISTLQKGHSTLDSIFGTRQDSRKYKLRTKSPKRWDEAPDDDNGSASGKRFSDDSTSTSEDSPIEETMEYTSGPEEVIVEKYSSRREVEGSDTGRQNSITPSTKCEESIAITTSDSSQTTSLHAWLINQGKNKPLIGSNGLIESRTQNEKQTSPLFVHSYHGYQCSESTEVGDDLEPPFRYDNILRSKDQKRKPRRGDRSTGKARNATRNRKRKPEMDCERKGPSSSDGATQERNMNRTILLDELEQDLTTRSKEQNHPVSVPPKFTQKVTAGYNIPLCELKEELCRQPVSKSKPLPVPDKRVWDAGSRPSDFIYELKGRIASRVAEQDNLKPVPREEDRNVGRAPGGLIQELKLALANREKRVLNYDFSAAESKNLTRVFPDDQLMIELKQKLAHRHHTVRGSSVLQAQPSRECSEPVVQVSLSSVKEVQESIKERMDEQSSCCHGSKSTETTGTVDQMDCDGNMSTVSELGEHSAVFTNSSPSRNLQVENYGNERNELPLVVTTRKAMKKDRTADKYASKRRDDPFKELSRLNQILESQSDNESIATPVGANEAIESTFDLEDQFQKSSKYPWKNIGDRKKNPSTQKNQILVVDFVAPGKTPSDRGSAEMDLLSRYKEDILKERMKRKSIDRSVNGDQSISSIVSYKARLFPKKKEKPDNIPWWLPEETDSSTSSSSTVKQDGTIDESGDESSTDGDEISYGSSSYAATTSTSSSFFANLLKQR